MKSKIDSIREGFKNHSIKSYKHGAWVIASKNKDGSWNSHLMTAIVVLPMGFLYVGGDIDTVVFGRHHHKTPVGAARWIGEAGLDYAAEKAAIGMGGDLHWERDPRKAAEAIRGMAEEWELDVSAWATLAEIAHNVETEMISVEMAEEEIADLQWHDNVYEYYPLGKTVSDRVVMAHAACKRLCELILESKPPVQAPDGYELIRPGELCGASQEEVFMLASVVNGQEEDQEWVKAEGDAPLRAVSIGPDWLDQDESFPSYWARKKDL